MFLIPEKSIVIPSRGHTPVIDSSSDIWIGVQISKFIKIFVYIHKNISVLS